MGAQGGFYMRTLISHVSFKPVVKIDRHRTYAVNRIKSLRAEWSKIFDTLKGLEGYWGVVPNFDGKLMFERVSQHPIDGLHVRLVKKSTGRFIIRDDILTSPKEDLPLFCSKEMSNECKDLLENLLSGKKPVYPNRQDLVDIYVKLCARKKRSDAFLNLCDERLKSFVLPYIREFIGTIQLIVSGNCYLFRSRSDGLTMIKSPEQEVMTLESGA